MMTKDDTTCQTHDWNRCCHVQYGRAVGGAHLYDDVAQQPQVSVPHGPGTDQDLTVVAVMPLVID